MARRATETLRTWRQGITAPELIANILGLGATIYGPSAIWREPGEYRLAKVLTAAGFALAAGAVAQSFVSDKAGAAALLGGVSGVLVQTLVNYGQAQIGSTEYLLPQGRGVSSAEIISPGPVRETETVTLIRP